MTTVLLVDDEELVRKVVRVMLEAEEYDVYEASDGPSALAQVNERQPNVVVLDLRMPGVDGTDVCRSIKSTHPETKVLVLTSMSAAEAEDEATRAGADDFMVKPFSALALLDRVRSMMES